MWKLTLLLVSVLVALPGFAAPDTEDAANESLYVFDMNSALEAIPDSANRYDLLKFVSSLQGLVNREEPRLLMHFLRAEGQKGSIDLDLYWHPHHRCHTSLA